jgi:putative phosphoribosyl transferase
MTRDSAPERVVLPAGRVQLPGDLVIPPGAHGIVVFAHGSGSSRFSPRNRFVAQRLERDGFGTLLFDLLTPDEDSDPRARFDIPLLTARLLAARAWLGSDGHWSGLAVGYFGASTGAAAALCAAAAEPGHIRAVVSRGGRPDLACDALERVAAPTLLLVGGADPLVLDLNREALERLSCPKCLFVIPGATHLFAEPGTMEQVAHAAGRWFGEHLAPLAAGPRRSEDGP